MPSSAEPEPWAVYARAGRAVFVMPCRDRGAAGRLAASMPSVVPCLGHAGADCAACGGSGLIRVPTLVLPWSEATALAGW